MTASQLLTHTLWAIFKDRFDDDCTELEQLKTDLIAGRATRDFRMVAMDIADRYVDAYTAPLGTLTHARYETLAWAEDNLLTEEPDRTAHYLAVKGFLYAWEERVEAG